MSKSAGNIENCSAVVMFVVMSSITSESDRLSISRKSRSGGWRGVIIISMIRTMAIEIILLFKALSAFTAIHHPFYVINLCPLS